MGRHVDDRDLMAAEHAPPISQELSPRFPIPNGRRTQQPHPILRFGQLPELLHVWISGFRGQYTQSLYLASECCRATGSIRAEGPGGLRRGGYSGRSTGSIRYLQTVLRSKPNNRLIT
jgi:hypothetical protein